MKRRLAGFFGSVGILALCFYSAVGQVDKTVRSIAGDKWVITAEAGGVNYVEGGVNVLRSSGASGLLLKGDKIAVGDRVTTNQSGRAEILLNPGSYLRIAGDSTFEFKTTSLEDLQLRMEKGSAILEVFATNDFRVVVESPRSKIDVVQSGVYRVDVLADGTSRLEVWKGKAEVAGSTVKGGKSAVAAEGPVAVAKFDRDDKDEFELWSKDRAKELAKGNNQLKDREMRTALMRSFLGGRWNTYDSFGLWVYSAQFGRYCFLPFGYGWSSPYGFGFGADIWWYRLPQTIFYPPMNGGSRAGTNTTVGGAPAGSGGTAGGDTRRERRQASERRPMADPQNRRLPPFAEVQGGPMTGRRSGGDAGSGESGGGFNPGRQVDRSPVYSPTPSNSTLDRPGPSRDSSPAATKGKPSPID
jgi:hypothetical protein